MREYNEESLLSNYKSITTMLCDLYNNGDIIMTISTKEEGDIQNNIVYNHNYPVLSVREYKNEVWLLIGNSHGVKGKWGSDNPIWNNAAFREVYYYYYILYSICHFHQS